MVITAHQKAQMLEALSQLRVGLAEIDRRLAPILETRAKSLQMIAALEKKIGEAEFVN